MWVVVVVLLFGLCSFSEGSLKLGCAIMFQLFFRSRLALVDDCPIPLCFGQLYSTVCISVYNIPGLKVYFKTHSPLGNPLISCQSHLFRIFLETALVSSDQEKKL